MQITKEKVLWGAAIGAGLLFWRYMRSGSDNKPIESNSTSLVPAPAVPTTALTPTYPQPGNNINRGMVEIRGRAEVRATAQAIAVRTHGTETEVTALIETANGAFGFKLQGDTVFVYNSQTQQLIARVRSDDSRVSFLFGTIGEVKEAMAAQPALSHTNSSRAPLIEENTNAPLLRVKHAHTLLEYDDITNEVFQVNASAVAVLIHVAKGQLLANGKYRFVANRTLDQDVQFKYGLPLKEDQPFRHQGTYGFGTAFLGATDKVITAGHCLGDTNEMVGSYVVFNFHATKEQTLANGKKYVECNKDDVYELKTVLGKKFDTDINGNADLNGSDWAVVKLDRAVPPTFKIPKRSAKKPEKDTPLYVIGHPLGLPLKIDIGARVNDNKPVHKFYANLSIFAGNSGSPVFNLRTNEIEGILVSSDPRQKGKDFVRETSSKKMVFGTGDDINADTEHCNLIQEVEPTVKSILKKP